MEVNTCINFHVDSDHKHNSKSFGKTFLSDIDNHCKKHFKSTGKEIRSLESNTKHTKVEFWTQVLSINVLQIDINIKKG